MLREHIDDLHRISQILIERETIDKDQFVRLLAGETEDDVFEPGARSAEPPSRSRSRDAARSAKPRPFPLPGARPCSRPSPKLPSATASVGSEAWTAPRQAGLRGRAGIGI